MRDIVKAGEPLKETLAATVTGICQKGEMSGEDLERDCALFNLSVQEAGCLYARRAVKAARTGLHLSTVAGIERTWQEMQKEGKSEGVTVAFEEGQTLRKVVFLPQEGAVYVKEKELKPGSYKVATLASSFFDIKKSAERSRSAILEPVEHGVKAPPPDDSSAVSAEEVPEEFVSFVVRTKVADVRILDDSAVEREQERERKRDEKRDREYGREADFCRDLGRLPGIWPTHKVTTIDGRVAIIQDAAGYIPRQRGGREPFTAIDFAEMQALMQRRLLPRSEKKRFLDMMGEALMGVDSLHKRGIIHRDLKMPNLLISREGKGFVSDLGTLCHIVGDEEKRVGIGTPYFMAPEVGILPQLTESSETWKAIGPEADIWSIGITLWELASGKPAGEHPSIQLSGSSDDVVRGVALLAEIDPNELAEKDRVEAEALKQSYLEKYQPPPPGSLADLVWRCTRFKPEERPTLDEIRTFYAAWSEHVKGCLDRGEISSISECYRDVVGERQQKLPRMLRSLLHP